MSRWLAGAFALRLRDRLGGRRLAGGHRRATTARRPAPEHRPGARPTDAEPGRAREGEAMHFTVSASGDLLMHQPLLDRALANGGGDEYDFAPFFERSSPTCEGVDLGLCHLETPMGPGPPATYPIFNTPTGLAASIHRSGWDACDTASNHSLDEGQAGIDGTVKALARAGVEHTGSFASKQQSRQADDPRRRRGQDRLRRLHRRDQRLHPAEPVVAQRVCGRRSEGGREGDHRTTPARPATRAPTR